MKVICIDASYPCAADYDRQFRVVEGGIYTVADTVERYNMMWYVLKEDSPEWAYRAHCFVPLSDIDETELVNTSSLRALADS